jgi:hypothetical protein
MSIVVIIQTIVWCCFSVVVIYLRGIRRPGSVIIRSRVGKGSPWTHPGASAGNVERRVWRMFNVFGWGYVVVLVTKGIFASVTTESGRIWRMIYRIFEGLLRQVVIEEVWMFK